MAAKKAELVVRLGNDDEAVLRKCAPRLRAGAKAISIERLDRVGYSGSTLYKAWGTKDASGKPVVIKIADEEIIDEESQAVTEAKVYFEELNGVDQPIRNAGRAGLIYPLFADTPGATSVTELKDVAFENLTKAEDRRRSDLLTGLYSGCFAYAHESQQRTMKFGPEYRKYRRMKGTEDPSERRIASVLGEARAGDRALLETSFPDPRSVRELVEDRRTRCAKAHIIHGDLHPNNVMIDSAGRPKLIDFAWATRNQHVLKDFVLLECSLRFLLFDRVLPHDQQYDLDLSLLAEDGPVGLKDDAKTSDDRRLRRLGAMLTAIRKGASAASGPTYDFEDHYLTAQFLMLFGLLQYDGYNLPYALRALGMIGQRITS
jgi:hypothetical protein